MKMKSTVLIIMASFFLISYAIAQVRNVRIPVKGQPGAGEKIAAEKTVTDDTVEFVNGDVLTGDIVAISGDTVEFNVKMIPDKCSFPLKNVRNILFPDKRDKTEKEVTDQVILPNGDRLSLNITSMNDKNLDGTTLSGGTIKLDKVKIDGLVFRKVPVDIMDEKFEDAEKNRFTPVSGEWTIEGGRYIQKKTDSDSYRSSAALTQQGRYRYQWTIDVSTGGVSGLFFFAKNGKSMNGGDSYYVMVSGRSVYLYKCIGDNQQYYGNYNAPTKENVMKFDLDYDSANGNIILIVDGQEAIKWKDNSPIEKGKYIILHASGRAAFDDIIVSRIGDSFLPSLGSENASNDVILFVNGDILSGKVVNVSEENVVVENEYDPEGVTIAKTKVSSIRFKKEGTDEVPKAEMQCKSVLWNDDVITGKINLLDETQFKVESSAAGELTIPRKLLKSIESPKEPSF